MPNSSQERVLKVLCDAQPSAKQTVDAASVELLEPTGWTLPDPESAATGSDIVERYLAPLAALPQIAPFIRPANACYGHRSPRARQDEDARP
jgi:hypothetical protein